jgi:hypothetical protein
MVYMYTNQHLVCAFLRVAAPKRAADLAMGRNKAVRKWDEMIEKVHDDTAEKVT